MVKKETVHQQQAFQMNTQLFHPCFLSKVIFSFSVGFQLFFYCGLGCFYEFTVLSEKESVARTTRGEFNTALTGDRREQPPGDLGST